ncbi:hypothetical protein ACA30_18975 [Virgibacillus soli]|uniref:Uncharacterized protein n=1 Tax=Lederbergia galactosidilytica TaxID=217031 RepID=A0A177ZPR9_9BACI|nr:hypothetical protein ACA30_18975 [Virgibacillus soli]OAK69835.1 hypothetical protein ABB05_13665 [Lederbergia galactosidilytica]
MGRKFQLGNYLLRLEGKGFKFGEDIITFIYFGKQSTGSSDYLAAISIELTLKCQKRFDPSFYLSFLERLQAQNITTKKQAYALANQLGLLAVQET